MIPAADPGGPGAAADPFAGLRATARLESPKPQAASSTRPARRDTMLPWALALAIYAPFIVLGNGLERAVAIGASLGVAGAAVVSMLQLRAERRASNMRIADTVRQLKQESEDRAGLLTRQFGWTIDDVVLLRRRLKLAELRRRETDEHVMDLRTELDATRAALRKAQQKTFELAAVDIEELRLARDAAQRARGVSEESAERSREALAQKQEELRSARQRVLDLTTMIASITHAAGGKLKGLDDRPQPAAFEELAREDDDVPVWSVGRSAEGVSVLLFDCPSDAIAQGYRLRDHAGAVVIAGRLRRQRQRDDGRITTVLDEDVATPLLEDPTSFTVEVRIRGAWRLARMRASPAVDKRGRVWSPQDNYGGRFRVVG